MKEKYKQLMYPFEFLEDVSKNLGIEKHSLRNYFMTGKFPKIHYEYINNALDARLKADEEVRNIRLNCYVKL